MNSVAPVAPAVKPIQFPVGTSIPFIYGAQDAASGLSCIPEMYFVRRDDQREYARGHQSVAGVTLLSGQLVGAN